MWSKTIFFGAFVVLANGILDQVTSQEIPCFTQPTWTEFCSDVLEGDSDGDLIASSAEYIAMLNTVAQEYGVKERTTEDPPREFYQLDIDLQLPFVYHFCDSLVELQGSEVGNCYETLLQSGNQSDELFGFPILRESEPYLQQVCSDIYQPALVLQWIVACPTAEEKENENTNDGDLVIGPTNPGGTELETIESDGRGPMFVAIGATGGILVLFLGLMYARHRNKDDDREDFDNASPVDGPDDEVAPQTPDEELAPRTPNEEVTPKTSNGELVPQIFNEELVTHTSDGAGASNSQNKESSAPVEQPSA